LFPRLRKLTIGRLLLSRCRVEMEGAEKLGIMRKDRQTATCTTISGLSFYPFSR
jgi:hypothetical protein